MVSVPCCSFKNTARSSSSKTLRTDRFIGISLSTPAKFERHGSNFEERYEAVCHHLLRALNELILWQAGEIEADGEIPRREGVVVSDDGYEGLDDRIGRSDCGDTVGGGRRRTRTKSHAPGGGGGARKAAGGGGGSGACSAGSRKNVMEKDEDSFDRDLTTRRRVRKLIHTWTRSAVSLYVCPLFLMPVFLLLVILLYTQELLRNCHIVEALLMFVGVSFQLYRGRSYARTRAMSILASLHSGSGDENDVEESSMSSVTLPLIDSCCKYAYRLLREVMTSNFALTVLYLAGINSMVRHISLGTFA